MTASSGIASRDGALVFVHGAGSNADFWHEQRRAFPRAHYLNLPGHESMRRGPRTGDQEVDPSQGGNPAITIDGYAGFVSRYVEEHGLEGVVLDGHSMGGAITLTLALQRPAWLRAIVLTGTGARLRVLPRLLELLRSDYPAAADLIVELGFAPLAGPPTYYERARRNGIRRQLLRTRREVTLADYEACDRFDVMALAGAIAVPTLCIVGAQDQMTPPKYSRYLHQTIVVSRLEVVEGAGHMLPLEQPEEYNRRLGDFLSSTGA